jgi:hypothetical protein
VAGYVGGYFWSGYGWPGVIAMIAGCLLLALLLSVQLTGEHSSLWQKLLRQGR